jgi:hypothetical protein
MIATTLSVEISVVQTHEAIEVVGHIHDMRQKFRRVGRLADSLAKLEGRLYRGREVLSEAPYLSTSSNRRLIGQ